MTYGQFVDRLQDLLRVDFPDSVSPHDSLYHDLGFDSFKAFELLVAIEALADSLVPPELPPELFTLADAFAYYKQLRVAEQAGL